MGSANLDGAIAGARELTSELHRAHAALSALRLSQVSDAARLEVEAATVGKPVERAGRLAGLEYDTTAAPIIDGLGQGVDPGLQAGVRSELAKTRGETIAAAEANETLRISITEAEKAYQESLRPAKGGGGGKGSGGGGRGSSVDKEARTAERAEQQRYNESLRDAGAIFDATRTNAERYREELARIQRLQAMGILGLDDATREKLSGMSEVERAAVISSNAAQNTDVAQRAIEALKHEYSDLGDVAATIKDGARETFGAIVTGSGSAQGALAGLASRLSSLFANKAFDSIWGALAGSIGGGATGGGAAGAGFGGWISSALSSLGGYAEGTSSAARGLHLVGEKGAELVDFGGGERVYNNTQTRQIMSGGTSKAQAEVVIRAAEGVTVEQVRQISGDVAIRVSGQAAKAQSRAFGGQARETNRRG